MGRAVKSVLASLVLASAALLLSATVGPVSGAMRALSEAEQAAKQAVYEGLLPRLQAGGTARVIVRLNTPFQLEPLLPGRASVQAQQRAIAQAQEGVLRRLGGLQAATARRYTHVPFLALEVDAAGLADLVANPAVLSIQEDVPARPTLSQSIPIIGADVVWAQGYTGQGQSVAILDTGVDGSHPFLTGRIIAEACFSGAFTPSTSLCPNGQPSQSGPGAGEDCPGGVLGCDHGTHVAGIAAGNGTTFDGVAPDATILAVQVFSRFDDDSYCGLGNSPCALSWTADQISALEWVYDQRLSLPDSIASVNMSLGGGGPYTSPCNNDSRKLIIDSLRIAGIVTVIASGNDGFTDGVSAPACISSSISVASTTDADAVSYFSNVGALLTFFAPGHTITSSVPGGLYATWGGTSMAAPHVTGAWALLRSYAPGATVDEIQAALTDSGLRVTDGRSGGSYSRPRIQVDAAMGFLSAPPTSTATSTATQTATQTATGTSTRTATSTSTATASLTPTSTATATPTFTRTRTATATAHLHLRPDLDRDAHANQHKHTCANRDGDAHIHDHPRPDIDRDSDAHQHKHTDADCDRDGDPHLDEYLRPQLDSHPHAHSHPHAAPNIHRLRHGLANLEPHANLDSHSNPFRHGHGDSARHTNANCHLHDGRHRHSGSVRDPYPHTNDHAPQREPNFHNHRHAFANRCLYRHLNAHCPAFGHFHAYRHANAAPKRNPDTGSHRYSGPHSLGNEHGNRGAHRYACASDGQSLEHPVSLQYSIEYAGAIYRHPDQHAGSAHGDADQYAHAAKPYGIRHYPSAEPHTDRNPHRHLGASHSHADDDPEPHCVAQ